MKLITTSQLKYRKQQSHLDKGLIGQKRKSGNVTFCCIYTFFKTFLCKNGEPGQVEKDGSEFEQLCHVKLLNKLSELSGGYQYIPISKLYFLSFFTKLISPVFST